MTEAATGIVVALLVLVGQWVVARNSRKANAETNKVDGNDKLIHNLETRLEKVEERADKLATRVQALEEERIRDKSLIRNLWNYVVTLRERLRALGQPLPDPPGALDFDSPLV